MQVRERRDCFRHRDVFPDLLATGARIKSGGV